MSDEINGTENPATTGDPESDRKRAEIDEVIDKFKGTRQQQQEYEQWLSQQVFKTPADKFVFERLPISDYDKMMMIKEVYSSS